MTERTLNKRTFLSTIKIHGLKKAKNPEITYLFEKKSVV